MEAAFFCQKETRAHLHTRGTHDESRSDSASVYDAAGCDDRDLDLGEDVFEKSHEGDLAVMAAGFHAFDDEGIGACVLYAMGELDIRHDGDAFHAGMMEGVEIGDRVSGANGDEGDFLIADELRDIIFVRHLQHEVHAEAFART